MKRMEVMPPQSTSADEDNAGVARIHDLGFVDDGNRVPTEYVCITSTLFQA